MKHTCQTMHDKLNKLYFCFTVYAAIFVLSNVFYWWVLAILGPNIRMKHFTKTYCTSFLHTYCMINLFQLLWTRYKMGTLLDITKSDPKKKLLFERAKIGD